MRVLMLDGGDQTPYLSRLVAHLARDGLAMHYAADPRHKDFTALSAQGVVCHPVRVRHKLDLACRWRVRGILDRESIDVMHTIAGRDAYVGLKARGRRKIPTFVRRGAYAPISRFDPADRVVYGRRGADRFLVVSKDLVAHMAAQGLEPERLVNIYTGIWSPELQPIAVDLRARYNIDASTLLIAHVGNSRPVKGFDYLLDALALFQERGGRFRLLVAGRGYEKDIDRMTALGVRDSIELLGHVNVMEITPNVDLMVLPSRIDALPRAVIEATVVGTPVIGTRVGGVPEILDQGAGGVLVDPNDPSSLADALEAAARDKDTLQALARHAQERNRALFSVEQSAARHRELYAAVLR